MKIWVKFNTGFQLCPLILILPPRSREAGDAPVYSTLKGSKLELKFITRAKLGEQSLEMKRYQYPLLSS